MFDEISASAYASLQRILTDVHVKSIGVGLALAQGKL